MCVDQFEGSKQPIQLLEELSKIVETSGKTSEEEAIAMTIKNTLCHWLLRFPVQCVLVAEAVLWSRSVLHSLDRGNMDEVSNVK